MRKTLLFMLAVLMLVSVAGLTSAQDATPIEFGQTIEGSISNRDYEFEYTFNGNEGDVIAITMEPSDSSSNLDPQIVLRDADGDPLAANDDFSYPISLIVLRLPGSGEYSILATRTQGSTGSTEGDFILSLTNIEPVVAGSKLEALINSDFDVEKPDFFYFIPQETGQVKISFNQDNSEIYASLRLSISPDWASDPTSSYYDNGLDLYNTSLISSATFTMAFEAGRVYILAVSFGGYSPTSSFNDMELPVTITVS